MWHPPRLCYRTRALVHILVARWSASAGGGSDNGRQQLCDRPLCTETLCTLTRSDSISHPAQKQKGRPDRHTMARMCWLQGRHVTLNSQRRIPAVVSICDGSHLSQAVSPQQCFVPFKNTKQTRCWIHMASKQQIIFLIQVNVFFWGC